MLEAMGPGDGTLAVPEAATAFALAGLCTLWTAGLCS